MMEPVATWVDEPKLPCTSVFVHGKAHGIEYRCTRLGPHPGKLHEYRPRPGRMAVAEWL